MKPQPSRILKIASKTVLFLLAVLVVSAMGFFAWTKHMIRQEVVVATNFEKVETQTIETERFPVGVNIAKQEILEDPLVDWYVETHLSIDTSNSRKDRFLDRVLAQVSKWDWYQNLASPISRILVVYPGERREEVVDNFGDILHWNKEQRQLFSTYIIEAEPLFKEGKFSPGRYVVATDATPENVADILYEHFNTEILSRYDTEVEKQVPLADALVIASLLEREAYDFTDMRVISGIIWNRLFIEMPLQLDATLQYARGSRASEAVWWPKIVPADKFIDSPYNTYKNAGLPPAAISNPSVEAIVAALNPRETECLFYFHDSKGKFYCTKTYEEHVSNLKKVYGRGS
jgi:cell division protein YceG involved in septum cleavage